MGCEFQRDELINLIGRLEIEMLQYVMQEHACPHAALKAGEIIGDCLRLEHLFAQLNRIAIRFLFKAAGDQPGETAIIWVPGIVPAKGRAESSSVGSVSEGLMTTLWSAGGSMTVTAMAPPAFCASASSAGSAGA